METIGSRVRHILKLREITMTEFASTLNISQSMVSKICNGKANPSERTIADMCRVYGIEPRWLKTGEGPVVSSDELIEAMEEIYGRVRLNEETMERYIAAIRQVPEYMLPMFLSLVENVAHGLANPEG